MTIHKLIFQQAERTPGAPALFYREKVLDYQSFAAQVEQCAHGLHALGLEPNQRVAIYLPSQFETVISFFATTLAGGVFVPIHPSLKNEQVRHILNDCEVKILVTQKVRYERLHAILQQMTTPIQVVVIDDETQEKAPLNRGIPQFVMASKSCLRSHPSLQPPTSWIASSETPRNDQTLTFTVHQWSDLLLASPTPLPSRSETDMAALLYTSGSTGKPKGVILSHGNLIAGAQSVTHYLGNTAEDRLLAALPLSFDYGLSQLTTAFYVGASVALINYLLPKDIIDAVVEYNITGLGLVPPLWITLAQLKWPSKAVQSLRYLTNSGGMMPQTTLARLQQLFPHTDIYLMYGLTEAFRSTYLPPSQLAKRPTSIGRAIPGAEVRVLRADGSPCDAHEHGELVHRGPTVTMGYWNQPEATQQRFRPWLRPDGQTETVVWSGDTVYRDEEGFLYFVSRADEMIKTSGYRVSPSEIEEVAYQCPGVREAAAIGVPDDALGQAIVLVVVADDAEISEKLIHHYKQALPNFMQPAQIKCYHEPLPRNANGKIDRLAIRGQVSGVRKQEEM